MLKNFLIFLYRYCFRLSMYFKMKKLWIVLPIALIIAGCSVTFDFDGAMIERFTNKISYLYANCRSDIEWLQETMTPETIESMDQTCVASIKAITKIRWKIEKLKWKIGKPIISKNRWNNKFFAKFKGSNQKLFFKRKYFRNIKSNELK